MDQFEVLIPMNGFRCSNSKPDARGSCLGDATATAFSWPLTMNFIRRPPWWPNTPGPTNGYVSLDGGSAYGSTKGNYGYQYATDAPSFMPEGEGSPLGGSPTSAQSCNASSPPGFNCCPLGNCNAYSITNYYTYGWLITSDGSTNTYACSYINNVLQSCDGPGSPGGNGDGVAPLGSRLQLLMAVGAFGGATQNIANRLNGMYVKSVRVFTCADWATGPCNNTGGLYNSNGLTYFNP